MNINSSLITPANIPTSWTGMALKWGCERDVLHPPNKGQGLLSKTVGYVLVRPILRAIYAIGVGILVAPVGFAYHLGASAYERTKSRPNRSWEHLKAATCELFAIILTCMAGSFGVMYGAGGDNFRNNGYLYPDNPQVMTGTTVLIGSLRVTSLFFSSTDVQIQSGTIVSSMPYEEYIERQLYATRL